jgi:hypothetical protein
MVAMMNLPLCYAFDYPIFSRDERLPAGKSGEKCAVDGFHEAVAAGRLSGLAGTAAAAQHGRFYDVGRGVTCGVARLSPWQGFFPEPGRGRLHGGFSAVLPAAGISGLARRHHRSSWEQRYLLVKGKSGLFFA